MDIYTELQQVALSVIKRLHPDMPKEEQREWSSDLCIHLQDSLAEWLRETRKRRIKCVIPI
jgi:hypothetical protein